MSNQSPDYNPNSDLTLYRRAVRGRWNVPAKAKAKAIERIQEILDKGGDPELVLEAIKTAAILDKIDLQEQTSRTPLHINVSKAPTEELLERLNELVGDTRLVENLSQKFLGVIDVE